MNSADVQQAVEQAIAPLLRRIDSLTEQVDALDQRLTEEASSQPDIVGQKQACDLLGCSDRTLQRRRQGWVEGVHWWKESGSDRPLYNLPLIRDGQRQGFSSAAHTLNCQRWVKKQAQMWRKAGRKAG